MEEKKKKAKKAQQGIWFQFYAVPLRELWKHKAEKKGEEKKEKGKTLENLYTLLSFLEDGPKGETNWEKIKERFKSSSNYLPPTGLNAVWLLLLETNFYQNFLNIGISYRREVMNSERTEKNLYHYLCMTVPRVSFPIEDQAIEDFFWGRWIDLYELRYDQDIISLESQKDKFEEYQKALENEPNFFSQKLKEKLGLLQEKNETEMPEGLRNFLNVDLLTSRLEILDTLFSITFYITYRGWLRYKGEKANVFDLEKKFEKFTKKVSNELEKLEEQLETEKKSIELQQFHHDSRMLSLYHQGSCLIGEIGHFKTFAPSKREKMLKDGDCLLEKMRPEKTDKLHYHIWFRFYQFLHQQREAENALLNYQLEEAIEKFRKLHDSAEKIEQRCQGGFSKILLKVKYNKRDISFLLASLEILSIKKDTEEPYGVTLEDQVFGYFDYKNEAFQGNFALIENIKSFFLGRGGS